MPMKADGISGMKLGQLELDHMIVIMKLKKLYIFMSRKDYE